METKPLSEHFLRNFFYSDEPFGVIKGRIYSISRTNGNFNGRDALHILGKPYALDESEEISVMENILFSEKSKEIEEMMTEHIRVKYLQSIDRNKAEIEKMQNIYASLQDSSIEKFIKVDVFNAYNHENREIKEENFSTKKYDNIPDIGKIPVGEIISSKQNALENLLEGIGFIAIRGRCYYLYENGNHKNQQDGYVMFGGKVYGLRSWNTVEGLLSKYTERLSERIKQVAEEHGKVFAEILGGMYKEKKTLNDSISNKKIGNGKSHARRGEIGFKKVNDNEYEVSVDIEPYIIEKDNNYFAFGSVKIGTTITARRNKIMISDAPRVLSMPYLHPAVWADSRICYGKLNWGKSVGAHFNEWYNISNRKGIAKIIAKVLKRGRNVLTRGYVRSSESNVHSLEECNCKIAENRKDAKIYAKKNGIKLERIIKNDS